MTSKYNIGLVANIDTKFKDNIIDNEWRFRFNHLKKNNDVYLFSWRDLKDNMNVPKYMFGCPEGKELRYDGNLNNLDFIHVGQLGKINDKPEQFSKFLDYLEAFSGKVINPVETMRANLSKQYLIDLYNSGAPVIPTVELPCGSTLNEAKSIEFPKFNKNLEGIILKPKIFGESGNGVVDLESFGSEEEFQQYIKNNGAIIAQPLISDIYTMGENSLVFLKNKFIHGLNKHTGEMKINYCDTSKYSRHFPNEKEFAAAYKVTSGWPTPFDYVRVDMINSKNPIIGEVELVNPACYEIDLNRMPEFAKELDIFYDKVMGDYNDKN